MKRLYRYLIPMLGLAAAGCSETSPSLDDATATGTLTMKVSTRSETSSAEYDPMEHLTVSICNSDGKPIRKYTSESGIPERLELLAGAYSVSVEAGEKAAASFTRRFYKGEEPFTVTPGANTPVEVTCTLQNSVVEAVFDETIAENFGSEFEVRVMPGASYDESRADAASTLRYTENAAGYFTLDEGVDALSWRFSGTHASKGAVEKSGTITEVRTPGKYTLTFRYSPDLPGFIEAVAILVDDDTDDFDDTIIWSPDPTIEGDGFEISETQRYLGGEKRFLITTVKPTTAATLTFDGKPYDLLAAVSTPTAGLAVVKTAENALTVTLSDDFFTGCPGGDHALRIEATDNGGGNGSAECIFALQGVLAPSAADYDLWANTVTLRARVFDPSVTTVTFGLRTKKRIVAGAARHERRQRNLDGNVQPRMDGVVQRERPDGLHAEGRNGRPGRRGIRMPCDVRRTRKSRVVRHHGRPEHPRRRHGGPLDELLHDQQPDDRLLGQRQQQLHERHHR